jgi:uncharacterized metal-binding protein
MFDKGDCMPESCSCNAAPKFIFSCCGAADVGEIADLAARKLHREGAGKMYCLTGIGAGLNEFVEKTKASSKVLVIDGCPVDCAKKTLEKAGITDFEFIRVTDSEFVKGKSEVNEKAVETIAVIGRNLLKEVCSVS